MFLGANLSLSVMVFGWLCILYGLGWWESVSAILVGTTLGALLVSRSSLLGWRAGTNNSVASGAYFGVRGRLVASFVGLLLCIQYVALTIWSGGEVVGATISRLTNSEQSNSVTTGGYIFIAVAITWFAIYGYSSIVRLNSALIPLMTILMGLSVVAFGSSFDANYAGDPSLYALGTFWPIWFLAVLTAGVSGPISYVTQTGDWSRYVTTTEDAKTVVRNTFVAMVVGLSLPTLFGAFIAVVAFDEFSFAAGFVAGAPSWLVIPLLLIAVLGSLGQGSINLYSMGLDLDAILPKLSRLKATLVMTIVSISLVILGKFVFDAEATVTNSVLFLTALATAWISISLYGYAKSHGEFVNEDLQVFNSGKTGGKYWYVNGWNLKTVLAWITGSIAGICGISSVSFVGPIANALGGVDVSIPTAGVVAVVMVWATKAIK